MLSLKHATISIDPQVFREEVKTCFSCLREYSAFYFQQFDPNILTFFPQKAAKYIRYLLQKLYYLIMMLSYWGQIKLYCKFLEASLRSNLASMCDIIVYSNKICAMK